MTITAKTIEVGEVSIGEKTVKLSLFQRVFFLLVARIREGLPPLPSAKTTPKSETLFKLADEMDAATLETRRVLLACVQILKVNPDFVDEDTKACLSDTEQNLENEIEQYSERAKGLIR